MGNMTRERNTLFLATEMLLHMVLLTSEMTINGEVLGALII